MKINKIYTILGIAFFVFVILTWIVPTGAYQNGVFTKGAIEPIGLLDLIRIPLTVIANNVHYILVFLLIGGLYGVLNKTGAYSQFVQTIVKKFKQKENHFLIYTVVFFALLSSLTSLNLVLFILVPFAISALRLMNFSKVVSMLATIGAILVGTIGSTYGFNGNGYLTYLLNLDIHKDFIINFIILGLFTYLLIFSILQLVKKEKKAVVSEVKKKGKDEKELKKESKDIILYEEKSKTDKSAIPMVVIIGMLVLLLLVGSFNWHDGIKFEWFTSTHTDLFGEYPWVFNILGTISSFGNWGVYEISIMLFLFILLLVWVYGLKLKEAYEGFVSGAKQMLPTAIAVSFAFLLYQALYLVWSATGQNIFYTILHWILGITDQFSYLTYAFSAVISTVIFSDFLYSFAPMLNVVLASNPDSTLYPLIAIVSKFVYGLVSFISPTSLLLLAGLIYLKVPYKDWFKSIWKMLLLFAVVMLAVTLLMAILV